MASLPRLLVLLSLTGCAPEVLLARSEQARGGAGAGGVEPAESGAGGGAGAPAPSDNGGAAGEPPVAPEPPRILADSVADFSLVQGDHDWFYGHDDGNVESFTLMTRLSVITTFVPMSGDKWDCWASDTAHWTQLFRLGGHPNGTDTSGPSVPVLERAVRRWISTYEGDVVIRGELAKIDLTQANDSNGVEGSVLVDGVELYRKLITGQDGAGTGYEVQATVRLGSKVDFVLDPFEGSDHNDLSRFTAVIARSLEPRSL